MSRKASIPLKISVATERFVTIAAVAILAATAPSEANAQDVTYQLLNGGGVTADITLANYTPGTALVNSDFVSFSLISAGDFSYSVSSAQLSSLTGTLNPGSPSADTIDIVTSNVLNALGSNPKDLLYLNEFSESASAGQYGIATVCHGFDCPVMIQGGTGRLVSKVAIPPGNPLFPPARPTATPELDPGSMLGGATLLFGSVAVLLGRRRLNAIDPVA
jgi:hypothetical protein